jgi:DNA-binding MarR family transcriptional regulator
MPTSTLHLALALEANGPRATLSARGWQTLRSLLVAVDPDAHDIEISHRALAHRAGYTHPRTISRALAELVDAGLVEHVHGNRDGHGTTDVHVSYVRVWVEAVDTLLDAGREYIARIARDARAATLARMRFLLDYRARARAKHARVAALAGALDVALEPKQRQTRRSLVVDNQSVSPPGRGPDPGGDGVPDLPTYFRTLHATTTTPLDECEHGAEPGRCALCRRKA